MALAPLNPETRNLIGGRLVAASNGATFENVNPATEEVIGVCADGTKDDMHAAIAAARRAFDETDWSTNAAFRKRACAQLAEALEGGEGGAARDRRRRGGLAGAPDLRGAVRHLHRRDALLGRARRELRVRAPMRDIHVHGAAAAPPAAPRGDRRRRRDHALELPALPEPLQARAGARRRATRWC